MSGLEEYYERAVDQFDPDEEEHKLEYTELFQEYNELLESFVQEFLDCKGISSADFFDELRESVEGSLSAKTDRIINIINAWSDFVFFVEMMKDKARGRQPEPSHLKGLHK